MNSIIKAESSLSLLVVISLFFTIYVIYNGWQSQQSKHLHFIYQQQQALQIAENQIALNMAGKPCKRSISQNSLHFDILCEEKQIEVRFPLGKIEIKKP